MTDTIVDKTPGEQQLELDCVGGHDLSRYRYQARDPVRTVVAVGCERCRTSFGCHVIWSEADDE